jgi:hypothetical protein
VFPFGHPTSCRLHEEMAIMMMMVREEKLDLVLVPLALAVLACYHLCLLYTILRHPTRTVIGVNALARKRWVAAMMAVGITHSQINFEL